MNSDSWTGAREARLDRAIDRAVREMMHVDPPAGLRRRVLSRLNAPVEKRTWLLPQYALAIPALLAVLLVVMWPERIEPPTPPAPPQIAAAAVRRSLTTAPPRIEPTLIEQDRGRDATGDAGRPTITRERIPMPPVTNVFGAPTPTVAATVDRSTGAALARPARIDVDSLAPLTIVPLSARPIQIPPLVIESHVVPGPPKGKT